MILYDARGNPFQGSLDAVTNEAITDARPITVNLAAVNAEVIVDLNGKATAVVDIRGTFSATAVFEATVDGTNYFALGAQNLLTQAVLSAVTAAGAYILNVTGFRRFRVRCSAYTSGAMSVAVRASEAPFNTQVHPIPSTLAVTVTAAANTGATLTIPSVAGLYHYITSLQISRNATAALAGTATLVITSTNLPGALAWSVGNAMAAGGTQRDVELSLTCPLKSSVAGTNTTIVMPVPGAAVLWRAVATYYVGL